MIPTSEAAAVILFGLISVLGGVYLAAQWLMKRQVGIEAEMRRQHV